MRVLLALFMFLVAAAQAQAGAWPRGGGNTFVALSYTLTEEMSDLGGGRLDPDGYVSLLIERGINDRYTFGIDAGRAGNGEYQAVGFVSRTLGPADGTMRFAVHAGGGYSKHFGGTDPLAYLGASAGRGLTLPWGSGWAALDTGVYYRTGSQQVFAKTDATLGLNLTERAKLFVQLQGGKYPGNDAYLRVVPSAAYRIGPAHVELGVPIGAVGGNTVGVKLGTWLEF